MFYSEDFLKTYAWKRALQMVLRYCSKKVKEKPGYIGVFATKNQVVATSKDYC